MSSKLSKQNIPFGIAPNSLLNHPEISFKAKGLFAFMQSKPDGWSFSVKLIAQQAKDGVDSVSEGLKELEKYGFLVRKKTLTSSGYITDYELFLDVEHKTASNDGNSKLGNSNLGNSKLGKSLNNSKKDISKKDISNKEKREGTALAFLEQNYPSRFETLMMQYRKQISDYSKFEQLFEATVMQEKLEYDGDVLEGRFKKFAINWVANQNKFEKPVIELNANQRKEKIGGF